MAWVCLAAAAGINGDTIVLKNGRRITALSVTRLFEPGPGRILGPYHHASGGSIKHGRRTQFHGRSFTLPGSEFFHIVEGRIRFQRGYWDKVTWFGQFGLPID